MCVCTCVCVCVCLSVCVCARACVGWLMTLQTIPTCQPHCGLISLPCPALNSPSRGSYSFCCHRRSVTLRTNEELVVVTLAITSLRCNFPIRTCVGLPIPQEQVSRWVGHGSLKHLWVTNSYEEIGPQRTDERMENRTVQSFLNQETHADRPCAKAEKRKYLNPE